MPINIYQRFRLWRDPNYINNIQVNSPETAEELLDYAKEHNMDLLSIQNRGLKYTDRYIKELIDLDNDYAKRYLVAYNSTDISKGAQETIKSYLRRTSLNMTNKIYNYQNNEIGLDNINKEYIQDIEIFKNIFLQIPDPDIEHFRYFIQNSVPSFREQGKIDEVVKFFLDRNLSIDDLFFDKNYDYIFDRPGPDIIRSYLRRDFSRTFTSKVFSSIADTGIAPEEIKEIFLTNLDVNIQNVNEIFEYFEEEDFTEEEKDRILDSIKRNKISITTKKAFNDCFKDTEIIFNSILNNGQNLERFPIERTPVNDTYNFTYNFSDEQIEQIVQVLMSNKKVFEKYEWRQFLIRDDNSKIINTILHRNLYFLDNIKINYIHSKLDFEYISNNYVLNEYSPDIFINNNDILIKSLKKNFDIVNLPSIKRRVTNIYSEEEYKKIYILAKENGYKWNEFSANFIRTNPYLFMEALKNGDIKLEELENARGILNSINLDLIDDELLEYYYRNYEEINKSNVAEIFNKYKTKRKIAIEQKELTAEEKIQNNKLTKNFNDKNPDDYLKILNENFYYIFSDDGFDVESYFTIEHMKKFAEIYIREMPKVEYKLNNHNQSIVAKNPYILRYFYENNIRLVFEKSKILKGLERVDEEYFRSIKDIYTSKNGKFVKNANILELTNPLIILEEIDKNPKNIDNISVLVSYKKDEIILKVKEKIIDGSYEISENTPRVLLQEKELYELIIDKDINNLKFISEFIDESEKIKYTQQFIQGLKEGKIDIQNNPQFPFHFTKDNLEKIMEIDSEYINILSGDISINSEITEYIVDKIISEDYIVNENTPKWLQQGIDQFIKKYYKSNNPENLEQLNKANKLLELGNSNLYLYMAYEYRLDDLEKRELDIKLENAIKNDTINLDNPNTMGNMLIHFFSKSEKQNEIIIDYFNNHPEYLFKYYTVIQNKCLYSELSVGKIIDSLDKEKIEKISDEILKQKNYSDNLNIITVNKELFLKVVSNNPEFLILLEDNSRQKLNFKLNDDEIQIIEDRMNNMGINYIISDRSLESFKTSPYYIIKSLRQDFSTLKYLNIGENAEEIIKNPEYYQSLMTVLEKNGIQPGNHGQLPEYLIPLFSELENTKLASLQTQMIKKEELLPTYTGSYHNFSKYEMDKNFILQPDMDLILRADFNLILKTLKEDWSFVDYISPIANLDNLSKDKKDEIIKSALDNNYILNEKSNYFFRNTPEVVMNSFRLNNNSIIYASPIIRLTPDEQIEIEEFARSNENDLTMADINLNFLNYDEEFIIKSLNIAKGEKLKKVLERIDIRFLSEETYSLYKEKLFEEIENGRINIRDLENPQVFKNEDLVMELAGLDINILLREDVDINTFSIENQRKLYELCELSLSNADNNLSAELFEKVNTDTNKMINDIIRNPENVDNYNFDLIYLPKDIRDNIITSILEDKNYTVTDRTPSFVRNSPDFVYNYLKAHNGELSGLNTTDLYCILDLDKVIEHREYLEFSNYYDVVKVNYSEYIDAVGIDRTIEIYENIGPLIKKFSPDLIGNINNEEIQNLIITNLDSDKNYYTLEEMQIILTKLDVNLTKDMIKKNPNLASDKIIFLSQIEKNPSVILLYEGSNEEVFKKALNQGFEFNGVDIFERKNFTSSRVVINYLLDKNEPNAEIKYTGNNVSIFERMLKEDRLSKFGEGQLTQFFETSKINEYDEAIIYMIDKYGPDKILLYNGDNSDVYEYAVDLGYNLSLDTFLKKPNILTNEKLYESGVKNDKLVMALKYIRISDENNRMDLIKDYIGEENFGKFFASKEKQEDLYKLTSIIDESPELSIKFFKAMSPEILQEIDYDEWKKFIKYSIATPEYDSIMEIAHNGKFKDFRTSFQKIEGFINDEQGVGINKYLNYAKIFSINPELCEEFAKSISEEEIKEGKLTREHQIQLADFETLMYNSSKEFIKGSNIDTLGRITEIKRESLLEALNLYSDTKKIKGLVFDYLFNMNSEEIEAWLRNDINTKTLLTVEKRAKEDGNEELSYRAKELFVLVDMIEQINYSDASIEEIKKFANNIFNQDINTIKLIRAEFGNLKEMVRNFYEYEAQTELTSVQDLIKDRSDLIEETNDGFLIIDVRNTKHTFYAHALSQNNFKMFFDTDKGKVTICVSPETDKHEAYYYNGSDIILLIDKINKGGFIGSSTTNMGSNAYISNNNYKTDGVETAYNQRSIRNSYEENTNGSAHGETLLYRQGLIPSGLILTHDEPSEIEKNAVIEIEKIINGDKPKDDPTYIRVPFVRTQSAKKRVVNYEEKDVQKLIQEPSEIKDRQEERIEVLRQKFAGLITFNEEDTGIMRRQGKSSLYYIIYNDDVYILENNNALSIYQSKYKVINPDENHDKTSIDTEILYTASKLQELVYGQEDSRKMDIIEIEYKDSNGDTCIIPAVKEKDARNLWTYSREDGGFSAKSNEQLLSEFLVDHLICNYDSGNSEFLMDDKGNCYGRGKKNAFRAIDDFITTSGETYNSFSFYYFDNQKGNNVYRKVFEEYIKSENPETVISNDSLDEFIENADRISEIPDEEYMLMFEHVLDKIGDEEKREKMESIILDRKNSLPEEAREFVNNIRELNRINNTVEVIKNPESVAFINDVHGNAEAIKEIFKNCEESGKKDIFILGDMIGIGPESNECIDIIRKYQEEHPDTKVSCILGNHEMYSIMGNKAFRSTPGFNGFSSNETRRELSPENRRFIESLPITRNIEISGKKVELTHFPISTAFTGKADDEKIYVGHGENFDNGRTVSGEKQDYVIYGHEHRTETTIGDQVGSIRTEKIGNTKFFNLPSSGCVHGKHSSYVTLSLEGEELVPKINEVEFDKTRLVEDLRKTQNPRANYFGVNIHEEEGGR